MTHLKGAVWTERLLLVLILASLGGTLNLVLAIHRRVNATSSARTAETIAQPEPPVVPPSPKIANSPRPTPAAATPGPNPAPPPPSPVEDPTAKVLARMDGAIEQERDAAGEADRRTASLEVAIRNSVAESQLWKRREMLVRQQVARLNRRAVQLEQAVMTEDAERDVLARERDALKAATTKASQRSGYSVLPYKGPNGTWRRPIVLECSGNTVKLLPGGKTFSMLELSPLINPRSSPVILAIAREMLHIQQSETPDGAPAVPYLVFLVRPDGIRPYYQARGRLESLGVAFGYELIEQDLVVDVPNFDDVKTWDGSVPLDLPELANNDANASRGWPACRRAAGQEQRRRLARVGGRGPHGRRRSSRSGRVAAGRRGGREDGQRSTMARPGPGQRGAGPDRHRFGPIRRRTGGPDIGPERAGRELDSRPAVGRRIRQSSGRRLARRLRLAVEHRRWTPRRRPGRGCSRPGNGGFGGMGPVVAGMPAGGQPGTDPSQGFPSGPGGTGPGKRRQGPGFICHGIARWPDRLGGGVDGGGVGNAPSLGAGFGSMGSNNAGPGSGSSGNSAIGQPGSDLSGGGGPLSPGRFGVAARATGSPSGGGMNGGGSNTAIGNGSGSSPAGGDPLPDLEPAQDGASPSGSKTGGLSSSAAPGGSDGLDLGGMGPGTSAMGGGPSNASAKPGSQTGSAGGGLPGSANGGPYAAPAGDNPPRRIASPAAARLPPARMGRIQRTLASRRMRAVRPPRLRERMDRARRRTPGPRRRAAGETSRRTPRPAPAVPALAPRRRPRSPVPVRPRRAGRAARLQQAGNPGSTGSLAGTRVLNIDDDLGPAGLEPERESQLDGYWLMGAVPPTPFQSAMASAAPSTTSALAVSSAVPARRTTPREA